MVIVLIYAAITFLFAFLLGEEAGNIVGSAISLLVIPFINTYWFLIYEDLKKLKGALSFETPKKGTKTIYIIVGIIGLLLIPAILISIVVFLSQNAREEAGDAKVIADIAQIRATAELVYIEEESYSRINCDHLEIVSLCGDIKETTGEEPIIYSSTENYCLYVKLPSAQYYCLDSTYGGGGKTSTFPGEAGYCDGTTFICP